LAGELGKTAVSQVIDEESRASLHKKLDEVIDQTNINPAHVKGFRVSQWEGLTKDADGEAQIHKLQGFQLVAESKDFQPKWAEIVQIDYEPVPFMKREQKERPKNQGSAVILPDPQIGFRRYADGTVDPFHDESAIAVALSVINEVQPTEVVFLGDLLDLPAFGRFEQSEDYAHTTNMALEYTCNLLDTIRSIVGPDCKITILEGNHEKRIEKQNRANMLANFSLRVEGDVTNFPVLSVPHLLNLEKRGIEYVEGYPAGKYWLNERLKIIHGSLVRSNGSTAAAIVKQEDATTIFGHVHRIESQYKTQDTYRGSRTIAAHSPGCLCRIDGAIPSAKGSTKLDGRPVANAENWQQGLGIVEFTKGDGAFSYEQVYINTQDNYRTMYRGKEFAPPKPKRKR
jgi:predicted phosphodiesterase